MAAIYFQQPYGHVCPHCAARRAALKDYGPTSFVTDLHAMTVSNSTFRTALWTGPHLQLTVMSLRPREEIGLERHPHTDQFIRIEQGRGIVQMGSLPRREQLTSESVWAGSAIFVPAGTWHNVINTGTEDLKLYSIYAPPNHPPGTVDVTKPTE